MRIGVWTKPTFVALGLQDGWHPIAVRSHWPDPRGGRKPINAKAESVSRLPMFREAYALRRCIVPIDGFFEWKAIRGARAKQPFAIAMKDGSVFGLAGLWENWKNSKTGQWERTFAIITVPSNDLVGQIHDRMPAILKPESYERWLGPETDPHDLLITYPSEPDDDVAHLHPRELAR